MVHNLDQIEALCKSTTLVLNRGTAYAFSIQIGHPTSRANDCHDAPLILAKIYKFCVFSCVFSFAQRPLVAAVPSSNVQWTRRETWY